MERKWYHSNPIRFLRAAILVIIILLWSKLISATLGRDFEQALPINAAIVLFFLLISILDEIRLK